MSGDLPFVNVAQVIRRGWVTIVLFAVLFANLAVLGWYLYPDDYHATATVQVDTGLSTVNMQTEQAVAQSGGVLSAALGDLNGWTLDGLRNAVSVVVPRDADVLEVKIASASPRRAAAAANAVAKAYLDDRRSELDAGQARQLSELETQITELDQEIANLSSSSNDQTTIARRLALAKQYARERGALAQPGGRLLSAADVPLKPSTPPLSVWIVAGTVSGLMIGFYVVSYRLRMRRLRVDDH